MNLLQQIPLNKTFYSSSIRGGAYTSLFWKNIYIHTYYIYECKQYRTINKAAGYIFFMDLFVSFDFHLLCIIMQMLNKKRLFLYRQCIYNRTINLKYIFKFDTKHTHTQKHLPTEEFTQLVVFV